MLASGVRSVVAGFSEWLAGRRLSRIALVALLVPLPLLAVFSAAIVVLTTNTQGWRVAAQDCAAALLLLVLLTAAAGGFWFEIGIGAGSTWAVAVFLGNLRRTRSLTLAVQTAVLLGVIAALTFALWNSDPQAYWEQVLRGLTNRARSAGLDVGPGDLVPQAAQMMTGMMSASVVVSCVGALFLGSWWAGAAGAQTFAEEFQALRMGRVLGGIAGILGVMFLVGLRTTVDDLLIVVATGFVLQGLAVIHWHGARREWPKLWPLALYVPLALVPTLAALEILILTLLGLVDNGLGLRRLGSKVV